MKRLMTFAILAIAALVLMACSLTVNLADPTLTPAAAEINMPTPTFDILTTIPQPTLEILLPNAEPASTEPPAAEPLVKEISVYFMDENRFIAATDPYEVAVIRTTTSDNLPLAVLDAYFAGPTSEEYTRGLRLHASGFTHVRNLTIEDGVAKVYLGGVCANNGAAYSVAALIMKNLEQFSEISAVKIYDEYDSTLDPDSAQSSLPYCLEP